MIKRLFLAISAILAGLCGQAQVSLTNIGTPYTQDFNTLAFSGAASTVPAGWFFTESGSGANTTYAADNGGTGTGNTYSYGGTSNGERAFGGLQSGSVVPLIGAGFTNSTGVTITSLTVSYTGEQWRAGVANRTAADSLNFQYSTDAVSLTTGNWTATPQLDFASPALNVAVGALDGNLAANRTSKSFTISGLNIPNGATFYLRWSDFNIGGADDGLAIDDFTLSLNAATLTPCTEPTAQPTALILTTGATTINGSFTAASPAADEYLIVRSVSATLSADPVDGQAYGVGQPLGGGVVILITSGTTFTDLGLSANTTYYYFIFARNNENCSGGPNYLTTAPLSLGSTTLPLPACIAPVAVPAALVLNATGGSITGSFTAAADANRYLIVRSLNPTLSASPVNGTSYTPGQSFGGGTIVTYTTTTLFTANGLANSTTYYFFVFAARGDCNGEPVYNTTALTGNTTTTTGSGGIPASYYTSAEGLTCQPLKTALKNIISSGTQVFTYTPGVWNAYFYTDLRRNDANTADIIWDIYTDLPTGSIYFNGTNEIQFAYGTDQCGNYSNEGDCYNREHSFPQSWFNDASPMVTDLHHLFPTDGKVNNVRGNLPFGEVQKNNTGASQYYKSKNESYRGAPLATMGYSGTVFEPRDEYKGDLARAQLYMATRYEDQINGWWNNGTANAVLLSPTDEPDAATRKLQVYDDWFIRLLFKWHLQDPVSQKEIDRNNAIYYQVVTDGASSKRQGNRNPFVDRPEFVALIWQCSGAIPVTLVDFSAVRNDKQVVLQWYATQETNFKQYVVERSTNGADFSEIGIVTAQNLANYRFTDVQLPVVKTVYYRLKLMDTDGRFRYSRIISVRLNGDNGAFLYPNPVKRQFTLQLQQPLTAAGILTISDMTGRIMQQRIVPVQQPTIRLDATALAAGQYVVTVKSETMNLVKSFVVAK
jgi:endonuclease I